MKKLAYIFIVFIIFSCKNESNKNVKEATADIESDFEIIETEDFNIESNTFVYEELSTQKLQEMYDLISLKHKHPEFAETIKSQLKDYTNENVITSISSEVLIKNIQLEDEIIQVSDSVQKMKLSYDVISNNSTQKDSIWAIISTKIIFVDGEKVKTKKIKFNSF
ncbi:MAG: hypothetical protein GY936_20150 [Ignavibacteriae bacterium]|nr:hypothetical protein [Ignavibacteriota bacterium]